MDNVTDIGPRKGLMNTYHIVFDLDGTMADCKHRLDAIIKPAIAPVDWQPNWPAFYERMGQDDHLPAALIYTLLCCMSVELLQRNGNTDLPIPIIDIITSRPEKYHGLTMKWLRDKSLPLPHQLHMAKNGDDRPDPEKKEQIYLDYYKSRGRQIQAVFEDRDAVVAMWRKHDVPCFQVAPGNY